jgi:PST family polysaccharide transporter
VSTSGAPPGLARATARGALWSYSTFVASKGIALVTTLVLARLLAPEDFGLVALALVLMNALDVVNDFGIGSAVIWDRGEDDETADVAFGLSLGVGLLLTVATVASAPLVADAFGEPSVAPIIAALSITFALASLGSVQDARLRRTLAFNRRFIAELLKALTKAGVTVALAVAGLGAWALVHGQIAGVAVGAVSYWLLAGWRPRLRFDPRVARRLLDYGGQITVLGVLAVAASNVDYLIVGRRLGTEALGYYTLAFRLPGLLIITSCAVLSQVVFPAFAAVTRDDGSLSDSLLRTVRALAAVIVPIGLGLALVASDLVAVLFGDRWAPAADVMRWLAVFAVLSTLLYTDGDVYKATGRTIVLNGITVVQLLIAVPLLWVGAGTSIEAVAVAQVVTAALVLVLRVGLLARLLDVRPPQLLGAFRPVLVGAVALAVAVVAVQAGLRGAPAPLRLLACVLAGATAYAGGLVAGDRRWARDTLVLFGVAHRPSRAARRARAVSAVP